MSNDLEFVRLGFDETPPRLIDYQWAWDEQRRVHAEVADGVRPGAVLLLEHADVYTAGRRTEPAERPQDGTPVVDVCLLYTSDAADEEDSVDLGGRRIIK